MSIDSESFTCYAKAKKEFCEFLKPTFNLADRRFARKHALVAAPDVDFYFPFTMKLAAGVLSPQPRGLRRAAAPAVPEMPGRLAQHHALHYV